MGRGGEAATVTFASSASLKTLPRPDATARQLEIGHSYTCNYHASSPAPFSLFYRLQQPRRRRLVIATHQSPASKLGARGQPRVTRTGLCSGTAGASRAIGDEVRSCTEDFDGDEGDGGSYRSWRRCGPLLFVMADATSSTTSSKATQSWLSPFLPSSFPVVRRFAVFPSR
jgi:hypothetical protein